MIENCETLEQIANLARVSRSTASRVINSSPYVSLRARKQVLKVIHRTDYQPHQAVRTLVARRTNTIGLIIPQPVPRLFTDPFFPQLAQGISEVCHRRGYYLMLTLMATHADRDSLYRRMLHSGQLDGILVASAVLDDPIIPCLQASHHPCVLVGRNPTYPDIPWVDVDNVTGARRMTEYLISLGHRRIATITGSLNTVPGQDRLEGYRQALAQAEIAIDDTLITEGDFTEESGFYTMKRLMRLEPTAVFAASDLMAIGAIKALKQAGRSVPDDVSVAGYDDIPAAVRMEPQLTTVQQVVFDLGRMAAEKLIMLLDDPDASAYPLLPTTHLVVRGSTRTADRWPKPES
jgi:LacI family transcriptional regulator